MRAAQSQAKNAANTAEGTAAGYGTGVEGISSTLTPFLTRELNNPQGYSQQDQTAMLSASQGGAGGLAGGLQSKLNEKAAATGNASGFSSAAGDVARERMKAAAGGAENIAAQNAELKQKQQQEGAQGLRGLYGTDVGAQLGAMGIQNKDIGTEINAGQSGWLQNLLNIINTVKGGQMLPGVPGGGGISPDTTDWTNSGVGGGLSDLDLSMFNA